MDAFLRVATTDRQQYPFGWTFNQSASGFEHRDTCALRPNQSPSHLKPIFRKKIVQVVARNAPRNVRIALTHKIAILIANRLHPRINLAATAAFTDDGFELRAASCAHAHADAVIGQDFKLLDVFVGLSRHHRMNAAGVVAYHAAEGAAAVRSWVGTESQVVLFRGTA